MAPPGSRGRTWVTQLPNSQVEFVVLIWNMVDTSVEGFHSRFHSRLVGTLTLRPEDLWSEGIFVTAIPTCIFTLDLAVFNFTLALACPDYSQSDGSQLPGIQVTLEYPCGSYYLTHGRGSQRRPPSLLLRKISLPLPHLNLGLDSSLADQASGLRDDGRTTDSWGTVG